LPLIHKLVKPIKVARSRTTNKFRLNKLLVSETQPQLRATDAAVPRETDAAVRQELASFNMAGRRLDHTAELLSLLVRAGGLEVLNLREALSDKGDQGHLCDAADPRIAAQLRIESEQAIGLFRIPDSDSVP